MFYNNNYEFSKCFNRFSRIQLVNFKNIDIYIRTLWRNFSGGRFNLFWHSRGGGSTPLQGLSNPGNIYFTLFQIYISVHLSFYLSISPLIYVLTYLSCSFAPGLTMNPTGWLRGAESKFTRRQIFVGAFTIQVSVYSGADSGLPSDRVACTLINKIIWLNVVVELKMNYCGDIY